MNSDTHMTKIKPREHGHAKIWTLTTGPLEENTVLVASQTGEGFLFDPGDDAEQILALIQETGVKVQAILLTHGHFDHIGAVQPIREALNVNVYLHPKDLPLYQAGELAAARWNLPFKQPAAPDQDIVNDQVFIAGDLKLTARELPGHAPGHVIFVSEGFAIVGDTVFAGGIGRTDLPGGDHQALLAGIQREVLPLPPTTYLYPGHGAITTVERETRSNPFF